MSQFKSDFFVNLRVVRDLASEHKTFVEPHKILDILSFYLLIIFSLSFIFIDLSFNINNFYISIEIISATIGIRAFKFDSYNLRLKLLEIYKCESFMKIMSEDSISGSSTP